MRRELIKINRPDWTSNQHTSLIDLSNNVCFDHVLANNIQKSMIDIDPKNIISYANEFNIYDTIGNYYNINKKMISVGIGSTELLNRICFIFGKRKLKVLSPTFDMIKIYAEIHGIEVQDVIYTKFDRISISQLANSDVLYLANPNGNNGHSFTCEDIEYLLKNNGFVILDECYIEYSEYSSLTHLVYKYKNLCVLRSFSKSLGCAGIRCGFCYSSNEEFIELIQKTRINHIACGITEYILKKHIHDIDSTVNRMKEAKKYLSSRFNVLNSNGNFVCIRDDIDKFNWCRVKKVDDYVRITLTNIDIFEKNII